VHTAPARLGPLFALTLALPALFTAAWAWLVPGGVVERARAGERRAAELALATAAQALDGELLDAARRLDVVLELDAQRHVVAPFAPAPPADPAAIGVAEQAAGARLAAGDRDGALPFLAHAHARGELSPEGALRYAMLLAPTDAAAAQRVRADALARHGTTHLGGVPFPLLAALDPPDPAALAAAAPRVPAEAFAAVARELAPHLPAPQLDALRAAAATALRHRDEAAPTAAAPGPDGCVLVPLDERGVAAVPAAVVAAARERAFAAARTEHPAVALRDAANAPATSTTDAARSTLANADGAVARLDVPALGTTWGAHDAGTPPSALLALAARGCLVLALATLVAGNLLLWRSTRRELALVRLRADFVDVVSHELRTPLAALSLKAEMLAHGDVPAARTSHYLAALHADVRRLADQVERILDFGRLEKGRAVRRERLPARAVLARGVREGRPALRLVGQHLELDAPRALPELLGDADVLGRALRNLLENAAKYAPAGSTVAVRAFAERGEVVIEVADRGPGVPVTERGRIFQPFVRGSAAPTAIAGSGLGLALVAAAARVHRGHVDVRARDGGGAVFTLRLPAARGQENAS
jgi:signal transduction histidine kinase